MIVDYGYLHLSKYQQRYIEDRIIPQLDITDADCEDETCEVRPPWHYEVHPGGLGDSIFLVFKGTKYYVEDDPTLEP